MAIAVNIYRYSRDWFNFSFENPDIVKPLHTAIYFFAIEHKNRLGGKEKFGFPTSMTMEAVGIKNYKSYKKSLLDLVKWGFIIMLEESKNQYSSNVIALYNLSKAPTKAPTKALDKALLKHSTKQVQSTVSIDKQVNNITIKQETINNESDVFNSENKESKIIEYINKVSDQDFDFANNTLYLKLARSCLETTNFEVLKKIILHKWKDPKFELEWFNPSTLLGKHFDKYRNQFFNSLKRNKKNGDQPDIKKDGYSASKWKQKAKEANIQK